jgi:hypothetical protein
MSILSATAPTHMADKPDNRKQRKPRKTLQLDFELIRKAEIIAAIRGTTVPKLIEELIEEPITEEFDARVKPAPKGK